jgi:hypothetical protein
MLEGNRLHGRQPSPSREGRIRYLKSGTNLQGAAVMRLVLGPIMAMLLLAAPYSEAQEQSQHDPKEAVSEIRNAAEKLQKFYIGDVPYIARRVLRAADCQTCSSPDDIDDDQIQNVTNQLADEIKKISTSTKPVFACHVDYDDCRKKT